MTKKAISEEEKKIISIKRKRKSGRAYFWMKRIKST